jgi:hypothetical protein
LLLAGALVLTFLFFFQSTCDLLFHNALVSVAYLLLLLLLLLLLMFAYCTISEN